MSSAARDAPLCIGLSWEQGRARLRFARGHGRVVSAGATLAFQVTGARRCIGMHGGGRDRTVCPRRELVGDRAQCDGCQAADPGRRVARDLDIPPGVFRVYLALFGRDTVKVGVTSQHRADNRLLEQGAMAHVFVASALYPEAREAEQLVSRRLGLPQQVAWRRKRELWTEHPDSQALARLVAPAQAIAAATPAVTPLEHETIVDDTVRYGVAPAALPRRRRVVERLCSGDVLQARVEGVVGRMVALDGGGVVLDAAALAGWELKPVPPDAVPRLAGMSLVESVVEQARLF